MRGFLLALVVLGTWSALGDIAKAVSGLHQVCQ